MMLASSRKAERNIRAGDMPEYDYGRSGDCPLEQIMDAAIIATERDAANLEILAGRLEHDDSTVRYWAMQGLLLLGEKTLPLLPEIKWLFQKWDVDPAAYSLKFAW